MPQFELSAVEKVKILWIIILIQNRSSNMAEPIELFNEFRSLIHIETS